MLTTVKVISVQLSRLRTLQDELDQFETIALILRTIITVQAEVSEDQVRSLLQNHVVETLEVKLVQRGLLDAERNLAIVEVAGQVNQEKG